MKRIAILATGWFCLTVGIAGLSLPVLQGFLLVGVGLWLLSKESRAMREFTNRLVQRYPRQHQRLLVWKSQVLALFKR